MKTLTEITARDLLRSPVITLPEDASIEEAITVFEDEDISGLPIVDDSGRPIGVLTQHDIARAEHLVKGRIETGRDWSFGAPGDAVGETMEEQEGEIFSREDYSPQMLGRDTVRDWMTPRLVTAAPDVPLKTLCDVMRRESIHRVLILRHNKLLGIVTASDIVSWLADSL